MASLMESYEQQFANLTAEITSKTVRIPNLTGAEKQTLSSNVEKLLDETRELLEQMDLEVLDLQPKDRNKYQTRLKSYRTELSKLEKALKQSRIAFSDEIQSRDELFGDDSYSTSADQKTRLLENSERMERGSKRLEEGYRIALETEQLGATILEDLSTQRESIQRSRDRLRETDSTLGRSSRILTGMMKRIIQNRLLLVIVGFIIVIVVIVALYFVFRPKH
ncbi:vesicle transport through interaction with t-SNAREs homolog 1A-like isoform X1 [Tubulanus polymorphus]|uniref:vesicle transport through interaction with t-SNAREs homolog 1A-like isoform X1 n=2 Tax=Tubulanus polymorphus TaxID=672921 RepID=UPI003DA32F76